MPTETFSFRSSAGRPIAGRLELPTDKLRGWAIFAHCFSCGKNNIATVRIARGLAARGIGVLRFDFAGVGERRLDDEGFAGNVADLLAAAGAMAESGMPISLLVGHSLGGAAILAAAGDIESVKAVATIAAPFDVSQVLHQFDPATLEEIAVKGEAIAQLAGRPFRVSRGFVEEVQHHDLSLRIARLGKALLVMHAPFDDMVDVDQATRIFTAARHPKSFVSLDDADHLLTCQADTEYAADVIATWAERYLPEQVPPTQSRRDVEAEETRAGKFQLTMRVGAAHFLADEPASVGGLGTGPTPYDLLSAALAACTTMTLRAYADHKGIPIERIRTAVGYRKEPGADRPDVFSRKIALEGTLSAEQQARMLEIADRCPVHMTLKTGSRFDPVASDPPAEADPVETHASLMNGAVEGLADTP